jgi:DNA-binding CsgD family transcriptional regulator
LLLATPFFLSARGFCAVLSYERESEADVLLQRSRPLDVLLDVRFSVACAEPAAIEMLFKAFGETESGNELPSALLAALGKVANGSGATVTEVISGYLLHLKELKGREQFYLVSIEPVAQRDHIARATERFSLSRRENEVLTLVLRGDRANDIALELGISSATVGDHLTNLLRKTRSRNRSEMLSKVMHS